MMESRIYTGTLSHSRKEPVRHAFMHPVWFLCASLDDLDRLPDRFAWFSRDRFAPCSIRDADYLAPGPGRMSEKLARVLSVDEATLPADRICLLTVPRVGGIGFNPFNLYACLNSCGSAEWIVAEVNNTYGESIRYVAYADGLRRQGPSVTFRFAKKLFVSPFNGVEGDYLVTLSEPFDAPLLNIGIDLVVDGRTIIRSAMRLRGVPIGTRAFLSALVRHPCHPSLTRCRIALQAIVLRYAKGLPSRMKPMPPEHATRQKTSRRRTS